MANQANTETFKHEGHDVVPDVDPTSQVVLGWRVPLLGSHRYSRKRDALRALKTRLSKPATEVTPSQSQI